MICTVKICMEKSVYIGMQKVILFHLKAIYHKLLTLITSSRLIVAALSAAIFWAMIVLSLGLVQATNCFSSNRAWNRNPNPEITKTSPAPMLNSHCQHTFRFYDHLPLLIRFQNFLQVGLQPDKILPKTRGYFWLSMLKVEVSHFFKINFALGLKRKTHCLSLARSRLIASSPGSPATEPELNSASRRSASIRHTFHFSICV